MNERLVRYSKGRRSVPVGCGTRLTFTKDISKNPPKLVKTGQTDQYAYIQSFKSECDVELIVSRFANGDSTVLQRVQGLYGDFTGIPSDTTEVMNSAHVFVNVWNSLPDEVKAIYENDFDKFVTGSHNENVVSNENPNGGVNNELA